MSDSKHVAIYLPSLGGGGAERAMVTIANSLAARGHRVDLVLSRAEGPFLREVSPAVNVVDFAKSRVIFSFIPLIHYLRYRRPDALLSALTHANLVSIVSCMFASRATRLVVSERSSIANLGDGILGILFRKMISLLYPRADAVIALTQAGAYELKSFGLDPSRVIVIPNPVHVEHLKEMSGERPDHPWLTACQPPILLAVGRLEPVKDYVTLLEAFAEVRKRHVVRLVILGEGSERLSLESQIEASGLSDSVLLAGFDPNPFGWMGACAAYVLTSRHEGFPNSLVQAMACGARVVSTNCPHGPAEILAYGRWGRLVPVGDVQELADAIAMALGEKEWPDARIRTADFSLDFVIDLYENQLIYR